MTSVIHHYSENYSFGDVNESIGSTADACEAAWPARCDRGNPDLSQDHTAPTSIRNALTIQGLLFSNTSYS